MTEDVKLWEKVLNIIFQKDLIKKWQNIFLLGAGA